MGEGGLAIPFLDVKAIGLDSMKALQSVTSKTLMRCWNQFQNSYKAIAVFGLFELKKYDSYKVFNLMQE